MLKDHLWLVYPKFFPPKGVSRLPTTKSDSLSKDAIGSNIVEKLPSAFFVIAWSCSGAIIISPVNVIFVIL